MPVYVPNTTWVDGSGGGTPLSAARLNNMELGISPPYIAYTPTWTAAGTAPAIGNAVITARYVQIGKLVHAYGKITFGSTSTFGTSTYSFALPVNAAAALAGTGAAQGTSYLLDLSSTNVAAGTCFFGSASTLQFLYGATYLGAQTVLAATAPWTWAVGDVISWNILYEAA